MAVGTREVEPARGIHGPLEATLGDITKERVDAIVNAANTTLLGGGGVDGAIHRAAGPELLWECRKVAPCPPGEARVTKAYKLPAKWVVHTVGPIWSGGRRGEAEVLARCYHNSLQAAELLGARTVAFPAISTGAYGYPAGPAAEVAVRTVRAWLDEGSSLQAVRFVCFSEESLAAHESALRESA